MGQFRTEAHLSQQALAGLMRRSLGTIGNWERGDHLPRDRAEILELAKHLHLDSLKRDQLLEAALLDPVGSIWTIPFKRNLLFTGREDILQRLHLALHTDGMVALRQPQALKGLGGVGKTHIAVEYAYRHCDEYRVVLWIPANSTSSLTTSLLSIAQILNLPQQQAPDSLLNAFKHWLRSHGDWLLILDDVEDLTQVEILYPEAHQGHVLITTRSQFLGGVAASITVDMMDPDEGAIFLLRRAGMLDHAEDYAHAPAVDLAPARAVSLMLGGLPLALDQAGAYMEETGCGLSGYVTLYQAQRSRLLKERGRSGIDHPESVTITFTLALQKVAQANTAAVELLQLCAFLAPDAIPEQLLPAGKDILGPVLAPVVTDPFQMNASLRALLAYSLIQREARSQLLYIHQIVQAVLIDRLSLQEQQSWAEKAVRVVNAAFPEVLEKDGWQRGTRLLPHALVCLSWQERWEMHFAEAVHLLSQTGNALWVRGQYQQAQVVHKRVLSLRKSLLGSVHPDIARSLTYLANASADQGNYREADLLYQQALELYEQIGGETRLDAASVLNAWAECYRERAEGSADPRLYERADALYQRAIDLLKQIDDAPTLALVATISNRTGMQIARGYPEEAEAQLLEAIPIFEQYLGSRHLFTAVLIGNLGVLYCTLHRFDEAESLLCRARSIFQELGEQHHPRAAQVLCNLADLYMIQEKFELAEALYREAIVIYEAAGAATHPHMELFLRNHAIALWRLKCYTKAQTALTRAEALLIAREGESISNGQLEKPLTATQEQVATFFLACCEFGDQAKGHQLDLWGVYEDWSKRHNKPLQLHSPEELTPFLIASKCSRNHSDDEFCWLGIALRKEYYEISLRREQSDAVSF